VPSSTGIGFIARLSTIALLLVACSDARSSSFPTTTSSATEVSATNVSTSSPPCQSSLALKQVSPAYAKVIGTSPVYAAGMDADGVVLGSVVSGRLEGKILWLVDSSMTEAVTVTVGNLDATLAVRDQPAIQSATLAPANAIPSSSDAKFKEYPSNISSSGPGCVTLTVYWPPDGTWRATLRLTDA
jgi:hypothetical protein